jgi:RNA polymerase sigma-70 factor (ECF subfamily)
VLVDGKRLLVTGVLTPGSIAYAVAREALDNGAEVVLTGFGRTRSLTERTARRLPSAVDVLELDANKPEDVTAVSEELARRFLAAVEEGDTDGLVGMLATDAVMYGDGGGKAPAVGAPLHGALPVARFLAGLGRLATRGGVTLRPAEVNGQPGAIAFDPEGRLVNVVSLDIADGLVQTVHSIINPDKLRHLGPLSDWSWFGGPGPR